MESENEEKMMLSRNKRASAEACRVCGDYSTGKHYGVFSCDGCSGFFKRTSKRSIPWRCKSRGNCHFDKDSRRACKACRLKKCLQVGMCMDGMFKRTNRVSSPVDQALRESSVDLDYSITNTNVNDAPDTTKRPLTALNTPLISSVVVKSEVEDITIIGESNAIPQTTERNMLQQSLQSTDSMPVVYVGNSLPTKDKGTSSLRIIANQQSANPSPRILSNQQPASLSPGILANQQLATPSPLILSNQQSASPSPRIIANQQPASSSGLYNFTSVMKPPLCSTQDLVKAVEPVHFLPAENVHDVIMRLMTSSLRFARNLPCFMKLPFRDQIILLEESWKKLFLLDAAYWNLPLDVASVVTTMGQSSLVRQMQEVLAHLRSFRYDLSELACLKAIVIFRPETKGLKDADSVDRIQDDIQQALSQHVISHHPNHPTRFGKLLLSLLPVQSIAEKPFETILFQVYDDKDIFETLLSKLIDT